MTGVVPWSVVGSCSMRPDCGGRPGRWNGPHRIAPAGIALVCGADCPWTEGLESLEEHGFFPPLPCAYSLFFFFLISAFAHLLSTTALK